jgi:hypothetical protein
LGLSDTMFFGVGRPFLDPLGGLGLFGGGTIGVLGVDEGLDILLFYCFIVLVFGLLYSFVCRNLGVCIFLKIFNIYITLCIY